MSLPISGSPTNFINASMVSEVLNGTAANDQIKTFYGKVGSSESWMYGGLGDDTYIVLSSKDRIIENVGDGVDTVMTDWFYILPANVENITLTGMLSVGATGNQSDNILVGNSGKNILDGLAGADEMTGGSGNDMFVLKGNDVIMDFAAGDYFDLRGFGQIKTFADVRATMAQVGADVIFHLSPTDVITVKNSTVAQFDASDFLLSTDMSGYYLTFEDEFNDLSLNYGTNSDGTWYPLFPRTGLAAHTTPDKGSVQYFTYIGDDGSTGEQVGIDPFHVNNGVLTIEMKPVPQSHQYKMYGYDYSSGMINTSASFSQTYGYFEIRTKLAAGQGLHDAFWMLPIDGTWPPEFDVVEGIGKDPTHVINVAHALEGGARVAHSKQFDVATATTEFHTYGVDWEPDYITWYIDGVAVRSQPTPPGLDVPVYLLASLGGGGAYAGTPDSTTPWPAHMDIDYIRVYASSHTVEKGQPVNKTGTDGADKLYGTSLGDMLNGGLGSDLLYGGAGDDQLNGGGGGVDVLEGSFGNDTYFVNLSTDQVKEGTAKGIDTVLTALANYTLSSNVERLIYTGQADFVGTGNGSDNDIWGGSFNDRLSGGAGNDMLSGGAGLDLLSGGEGNDKIWGGGEADTLRGNNGDDQLFGDDGNDLLKGDDGDDELYGGLNDDNLQGGSGNDILDGGLGRDRMTGGMGDDIYIVSQSNDAVVENAEEGVDTVRTSLSSYTLGGNVENLVYTGSGSFFGTGNALSNSISGGAAADSFAGDAGDDTYVINHAGDVIIEDVNEGDDTALVEISKYNLEANVENAVYTGSSNFTGSGNAIANMIVGGKGADRLDGLAGADVLSGGAGNDTYVVDNIGDIVIEQVANGVDRVLSKVNYTLVDNIETLQLSTSKSLNGTGNSLNNTLIGNAGANQLDGGSGADRLTGGGGNDIFVFQRGQANGDVVTDFSGAGAAGGDMLKFVGYGAGAFLTKDISSGTYVIRSALEPGYSETIKVEGVNNLLPTDVLFV